MSRFRPISLSRVSGNMGDVAKPGLSLALLLATFVAASQIACALVRSGLSF